MIGGGKGAEGIQRVEEPQPESVGSRQLGCSGLVERLGGDVAPGRDVAGNQNVSGDQLAEALKLGLGAAGGGVTLGPAPEGSGKSLPSDPLGQSLGEQVQRQATRSGC